MKKTLINAIALATELARNATNDELLIYPEFSDYEDEDDLLEEDGVTYKAEVQTVFDQHFNSFMGAIEAFEIKDPIYLKLDGMDGNHISVIIAQKNENLEAMEKIKLAFNEDMNCTVIEMSYFQVSEVLEGNVAAIQLKYQLEEYDYDEEGAPEPEQTTIYVSQTWVY